MENAETYIARWQSAGLLDATTASAIRTYEAAQARPQGRQWQVLLALILGGILLGAGVLLFVAAHWDTVSPIARLALVLAMLVFFHGLAIGVRERFAGFATAMHALGTVSAGAAIALVGQIFNMQEHWPAAIMLWALCAGAGWYLLRDQFQQTLTLLLIPAWIFSEYEFHVEHYANAEVYLARVAAVIAAAYLAAFLHSRRRAVFGILFGVGALLLPVCIGVISEGWQSDNYNSYGNPWGFVPLWWRIAAVAIIVVFAVAAWLVEKQSVVPVALAIVVGWALPWLQTRLHNDMSRQDFDGPSLPAYALVAAAAVGLVAWGVRIGAKALVNYGIAAFAVTVLWFYFSSVMDKLGRSLGLIGLGVLFLGCGWALEVTRRKLVSQMEAA